MMNNIAVLSDEKLDMVAGGMEKITEKLGPGVWTRNPETGEMEKVDANDYFKKIQEYDQQPDNNLYNLRKVNNNRN